MFFCGGSKKNISCDIPLSVASIPMPYYFVITVFLILTMVVLVLPLSKSVVGDYSVVSNV